LSEWVIFGSGPTLDDADYDTLPPDRIAVNNSALIVPNCEYVAAIDVLPDDHLILSAIGYRVRIVTPYTIEVSSMRNATVENYRIVPKSKSSTGAAVLFAIQQGASKIITYGIGGVNYCRQLSYLWDAKPEKKRKHNNENAYREARQEWQEYAFSADVELDIR